MTIPKTIPKIEDPCPINQIAGIVDDIDVLANFFRIILMDIATCQ